MEQEKVKKPLGRSLSDFGNLSSAEKLILNNSYLGKVTKLGDGVPFPSPLIQKEMQVGPLGAYAVRNSFVTKDKIIRAGFLKFLLLGGDELNVVNNRGVLLNGAYIEGILDLRGCHLSHGINLVKCFFSNFIYAHDLQVEGPMIFEGSFFNRGFSGDRLICKGSLFLRNGFHSNDEVRLLSAVIGSNFDCTDGSFRSKKDDSINAVRLRVSGNIFLRRGFLSKGRVNLSGASIKGSLECSGGSFISDEVAISLNSSNVNLKWTIRNLPFPIIINAENMKVGLLQDDIFIWADGSKINGFKYESIELNERVLVADRIEWLERQVIRSKAFTEFNPQPWHQLKRVLREMGNTEDAKVVGIAYQKHLRAIGNVGKSVRGANKVYAWCARVTACSLHVIFGLFVAYGYRPMRLVAWMFGVWLFCTISFGILSHKPYNAISPSDPLVFQNFTLSQCRHSHLTVKEEAENLGSWAACTLLPGEYPTFSPAAYSLDLLLPVVNLGLEDNWGAYIPSAYEGEAKIPYSEIPWGYVVRFLVWAEIIFGWISSLMLVATITGFSRRNEEN